MLETFLLKLSVKKEHDYTLKSMVSLAVMENPPKVEFSAATLWAQKQLCNQVQVLFLICASHMDLCQ